MTSVERHHVALSPIELVAVGEGVFRCYLVHCTEFGNARGQEHYIVSVHQQWGQDAGCFDSESPLPQVFGQAIDEATV